MSTLQWNRDAAAHLLRRAAFGGTPAEIDALTALGFEGAVSRLVDYDGIDASAYEAALAARGYNLLNQRGLQQWFLDRMANSPRRLEEKMTYFWNLHWTSGLTKVRGETLIANQNRTQRTHAVGRFDDMVVKMSQDPAMLVWLDNWLNKAAKPNENYARELMELFTLGIGNYSQDDVTAVARSLTGWTVAGYRRSDHYNGATFAIDAAVHDGGTKTILGRTGPWSGTEAIDIILNHSDARGSVSGRFLGGKLWSFFAYENPPDFIVDQLAAVYVSSGRVLREVLRAIFSSPEFYEPHARKSLVRSPVEYSVASIRMLESTSDYASAAASLDGMSQDLFDPEDAKGWDWGLAWMNTGTLFNRATLANTLASNRGSSGTRFNPEALLAGRPASTADEVVGIFSERLNVADVAPAIRGGWIDYMNTDDAGQRLTWTNTPANVDRKVRGLVHLMLTSPAFQFA
ncbi:MAG: DUF1800 domain-containing protein [Acidobacteriota bacterium]